MEDLVRAGKLGCEKSKEEIILRLKPLIYANIRRYRNYREGLEDLYQDGVLEILKGIKDFDFGEKVYFLGYIKLRLRYFYLDRLKYTIRREMDSLNQNYRDTDLERIDLLVDDEPLPEEKLEALDENLELYRAYEFLSPREKEVIDYYYIKGLNMVEISKVLDISYRTVINTKTSGINRLRKHYKFYFKNQ